MVNFAEHELFPALVAADEEIHTVCTRAISRLSDITHYTSHNQWGDAKLALNEIGGLKRKLNDLCRRGSEINSKIRASMQPDEPEPEPVVEIEPEQEEPEPDIPMES